MRHHLFHLAAGTAVAFSLSACDLTSLQKKETETQQPATEATVVGIWRTNIPTGKTPPDPTDIKVTMDVEADHTMLLSQRVATGQPAPYDYVEIVKEYWTWTVADGKMKSVKRTCTYKDPATMQETTTCAEPLSKEADINVKGTAWTVVEQGQPIVFRKD